ncbi:MAG: hypothetical protein ACREL7_09485 [Longimicrobiales bacterium]
MNRVRCTLCLLTLVTSFTLPACYRYAPVGITELAEGKLARTRVTAEQAVALNDLAGVDDRLVEGEIVALGDGSLTMSVASASVTAGLSSRRLYQRVVIPHQSIVEVETRRLDKLRTGLLVGVATTVAAYIVASQFIAADDPEGEDKPDPERLIGPGTISQSWLIDLSRAAWRALQRRW